MGWWSATIMGGDTPLDIEGDLVVGVCGIDFDDWLDKEPTEFRNLFNNKLNEMILHIESSYKFGDHLSIAYQVLGVLLMKAGSNIPSDLRETIVAAAEEDGWAAEGDQERVGFINDFVSTVKEYEDGQPMEVTSEGLFQKLVEAMEKNNG